MSTEEQSTSGAGLAAQRTAIEAECVHRGWHLVEVIEDAAYSAKDLKRPGVQIALADACSVYSADRVKTRQEPAIRRDGEGAASQRDGLIVPIEHSHWIGDVRHLHLSGPVLSIGSYWQTGHLADEHCAVHRES